jgi:hypothetical protein
MIPLFDGEIPIATPIEFIDLFSFNTASLSWAQISDAEDETKLESIRVKLVNGKLEFIAQIIPQKLGKNRWRLPEETLVLLSKERTKPITVEATYRFIDGTEKKWKNPYQMDFQKNLIIDFFDEDCSFE